jgi:hypothetical protein
MTCKIEQIAYVCCLNAGDVVDVDRIADMPIVAVCLILNSRNLVIGQGGKIEAIRTIAQTAPPPCL